MLPNISLDIDKYEDIVYDARNMIVSLYPEWTDFNYHDPGITMLELFSWIKESQQYYMDQIGEENRKKYLKLLGIQRRTKLPARAEVEVIAQKDVDVLKGTKFYAGDICFEAEERRYILENDLSRCISYEGEQTRLINRRQLDFGNKLKILPFGREPKVNSCVYFAFDKALPKNTPLRALIDIFNDYEVQRMPITDPKAFYPLAELILEINTHKSWQAIRLVSDQTHALLCSGSINFSIDFDMEPCIIEGLEGYYLRFRLTKCDYDVPPVIQAIRFNSIALRQRDTQSEVIDFPIADNGKYYAATELSVIGVNQLFVKVNQGYYLVPTVTKAIDYKNNCAVFEIDVSQIHMDAAGLRLVNTTGIFANKNIAGFGTGLPFQEFTLNHETIEYGSFELMTEDTEVKDHYLPWKKVSDFSASTPEDRHYVFDSATGRVKFGDCINGLAPEGTILIIGCVHTLGAGGNVKQNTINRIGQEDIPGIQVNNKESAAEGKNEETLDACFQRVQRMLKSPSSAVTYSDYESCVLKTQGLMIQSCKVIPPKQTKRLENSPDMTVNIVVKAFRPELAEYISDVYMRNIKIHLDKFRLLGTDIKLIAPENVGVMIYADVTVKPHYLNAQTLVEDAVKSFFLRYMDQFGAEVIYSELYGVIDRLECVSYVSTLSIEAKGNGISRTKEGNIALQANGVVILSGTQIMFSVDQY